MSAQRSERLVGAADLFGLVPPVNANVQPGSQRAGRNGYPAPPGTGPEGKRCRDCANCQSVSGGRRSFPKCLANKGRWTHGRATDINTRMAACRLFVEKS